MNARTRMIPICFPAAATGDLWHNAVAQICWEEFGSLSTRFRQSKLVSAVVIVGEMNPSVAGVTLAYEYLFSIGLPVALARFPELEGMEESPTSGYEEMKCALKRVRQQDWEQLFLTMQDPAGLKDVWSTAPLLQTIESDFSGNVWDPLPVDTYTATTIWSSYLHLGIPDEVRQARMQIIADRLCSATMASMGLDVQKKVDDLRLLVQRLAADGHVGQGAILFIYRRGVDFVEYNPHLDSNMAILEQVRRAAARSGKIVIRVPHGLAPGQILADDFDLFDIRHDAPMKAKSFTALFWKQARSMPEIFGVFGGRTGSLDIAAFIGHRCFAFDEPLLDVLCAPQTEDRYTNDYVAMQLPQHLRFLEQSSIMSIGLLDASTWEADTSTYGALRERPLRMWLDGHDHIRPRLPVTSRAFRYLESVCSTNLERLDLGVFATNLRSMWRESLRQTGRAENSPEG